MKDLTPAFAVLYCAALTVTGRPNDLVQKKRTGSRHEKSRWCGFFHAVRTT